MGLTRFYWVYLGFDEAFPPAMAGGRIECRRLSTFFRFPAKPKKKEKKRREKKKRNNSVEKLGNKKKNLVLIWKRIVSVI